MTSNRIEVDPRVIGNKDVFKMLFEKTPLHKGMTLLDCNVKSVGSPLF